MERMPFKSTTTNHHLKKVNTSGNQKVPQSCERIHPAKVISAIAVKCPLTKKRNLTKSREIYCEVNVKIETQLFIFTQEKKREKRIKIDTRKKTATMKMMKKEKKGKEI
jgi:hypothetical protein